MLIKSIFKKKKKFSPPALEKHLIPEEYIEEFIELFDKYNSEVHSLVSKYQLWKFIENIFPDLDFYNYRWSIHYGHIFKPYIEREQEFE